RRPLLLSRLGEGKTRLQKIHFAHTQTSEAQPGARAALPQTDSAAGGPFRGAAVKAMLFAAGRGTRLAPLTDSVPKPLIRVAGRPMIEYPLLLLRHYGITDIVVNIHHLGAMIEDHLGDGRKLGVNISYSRETELLDTGGGLLKAR